MAGQPKAPFYIMLFLVVAGLIGFAVFRSDIFAPKGPGNDPNAKIDPTKLGNKAESHDDTSVTTVKEYKIRPSETLAPVTGVSAYKPMEDDTVKFALNVWAGWGPIILANNGAKAGKIWKTPDGKDFKVELDLIDDPIAMRNAYASGNIHIGWATLDMVPLFLEQLASDTTNKAMPRIYQQVDWSNGGDGIVVRENIKTVSDLRGKQLVLAQNSPSEYFALNMLVAGGVQPSEVKMVYTNTAFEAARAFEVEKNLAGAVSWSPDIYKLSKVRGNRMLVTTGTANKLIADVWFARADFAKDHPDIIEGLVRGIFDGMEEMKDPKRKEACARLMGEVYSIPATEAMEMFADAHNTNLAENYQFFMNQNNPTNFERVWRQAYYLYKQIGTIKHAPISFDKVMDYSIIEKLGKDPKYSGAKDEYLTTIVPKPISQIKLESDEILTNTVVIHFPPNSDDLRATKSVREGNKVVETPYDPGVDLVLEEIAKLAGQFGNARIIIEGHTDSSMKGQGPDDALVKKLSSDRAKAVKNALIEKYKLDDKRFSADGKGWDAPADPNDPLNHAKNRRVEIKVYTAERT